MKKTLEERMDILGIKEAMKLLQECIGFDDSSINEVAETIEGIHLDNILCKANTDGIEVLSQNDMEFLIVMQAGDRKADGTFYIRSKYLW